MPGEQAAFAFCNILLATDFSAASSAAFAYAANISDRYQSKLFVAHAISLQPFELISSDSSPAMIKQAHERARQKIIELAGEQRAQADGFRVLVGEGTVAEVLLDMMRRNDIDLAILGTQGRRAFKKLLLGSIAEEVFRVASCPVLTVGPRNTPPPAHVLRHILYPVKFAPDSSAAAKYAISLAERYGSALTVMNVRENMPSAPSKAERLTPPAVSWVIDNIPPRSEVRQRLRFQRGFGPAPAAIIDFAAAAGVDLIVMSVKRVDPILASHLPKANTTYEVVSLAPCPVLTVR